MDLLEVLKNLIPCIKGKWFIGDGAGISNVACDNKKRRINSVRPRY